MRGGNLIPMEAMEGRYVEGMHRQLVKSSADANMNSARTTRQTSTQYVGGLTYD